MPNLVALERISLKNHPEINEIMIQDYLSSHPEALGLGKLELRQREKSYPAGGRLDLLFAEEHDPNRRYEVEVQLGSTDPSHIIRTIEYWDEERKRFPQYNHCAVIVAEDITNRFLNVISLFNGNIPIIAIQLSAYKTEQGFLLTFTKVLDKVVVEDDEDDGLEVTDRNYWEKRSTPTMLKRVDAIFNDLSEYVKDCKLKYNKHYIGLEKAGMAKNFITFVPKKAFLYIKTRGDERPELIEALEAAGIEVIYGDSRYRIRINKMEDYRENKQKILELIEMSMWHFGIDNN